MHMFIRRTTIKSRKDGKSYHTYRLVESIRTEKSVKQRTLLNLGTHFPYPRDKWSLIAGRIEEIVYNQDSLFDLTQDLEEVSQRYAALIIQSKNKVEEPSHIKDEDYHNVDVNTLEHIRPRDVAIEHVAYETIRRLRLDEKMKELGFNRHQLNTAIGVIIGRMTEPGSELSTHYWLQNQSGLGELLDYDYEGMSLTRLYQASDVLLKYKDELEKHLYEEERNIFEFKETITLYDLTNTYFEGTCKYNELGARGNSKEKRSDCPLVTLGLVLDASGFPKRSEVFAGNAGEPQTLSEMIQDLSCKPGDKNQQSLLEIHKPMIVMDAGIATEGNINWLIDNGYSYLVVSRKHYREFSEEKAVVVKEEKECRVKAYKKLNEETGEIELYCHSTQREKKENSIQDLFTTRFEDALKNLESGLHKKRCVKKYDKIIERIGRLKQRYSKASKYYDISIKKDGETGNAIEIKWTRKEASNTVDTYPGVYCLRTNEKSWDEATLWRTYTMLTDLEAVFRALKSELGLRPVFHQITRRVSGHLFITLLAYHIVHTIRYQLKRKGIYSSWPSIKKQLKGQNRLTSTMQCENGKTIHIRKSTRPEARQQRIYDALGISHYPGRVVKKVL